MILQYSIEILQGNANMETRNVIAKFVKPMYQSKQTNVSIPPVFAHVSTKFRSLYYLMTIPSSFSLSQLFGKIRKYF